MGKVTDPKFNPSNDEGIHKIKQMVNELAALIEDYVPPCRRRAIALEHLETASMYAVKARAVGDD